MTVPVEFVDAIDAVVAILDPVTVPVVTKIPNPRPGSFVLLRRTGGPKRSLTVDVPQVSVDSHGATEREAHDLAQQARTLINAARSTGAVRSVSEVNGPALFPDPLTDQPRYRQTFAIALRSTP